MKGILVLLCLAAPALAAQAAPSADLGKLQGSWTMLSGMAAGAPLPPNYVGGRKRELASRATPCGSASATDGP